MSLPERSPDSSEGVVHVEHVVKNSEDVKEGVQNLNQNDVFLGRGGNLWRKEGNHRLRNLCLTYNQRYNNVQKAKKPVIARAIVGKVKAMDPPGRFLKKRSEISESPECVSSNSDVSTSNWVEVDDDIAAEKVSQVFRDIRRQRRPSNAANVTKAAHANTATTIATNTASKEMFIGTTGAAPTTRTGHAAAGAIANNTITGMGRTSSVAETNDRNNINAMMLPHAHQSTAGLAHPFFQQQHQHYPFDGREAPSMLNKVQMTPPVAADDTCDSSAPDSNTYFSLNSATTHRGQLIKDEYNSFDTGTAVNNSQLHHSPHQLNRIDHHMMRTSSLLPSAYPQQQTFQQYSTIVETEQDMMYRRHQQQQSHQSNQDREVLSLLYGRNNMIPSIASATDRVSFPNSHISPATARGQQYHNFNNNCNDINYSTKNHLYHEQQQRPVCSATNMEYTNPSQSSQMMHQHNSNMSSWYRYQNSEENDAYMR